METRNANYAQITAQLAFRRGNAFEEVHHGGGGRDIKRAGSGNRIEAAEAEGQNPALQDEAEMQVSAGELQRGKLAMWAPATMTADASITFTIYQSCWLPCQG